MEAQLDWQVPLSIVIPCRPGLGFGQLSVICGTIGKRVILFCEEKKHILAKNGPAPLTTLAQRAKFGTERSLSHCMNVQVSRSLALTVAVFVEFYTRSAPNSIKLYVLTEYEVEAQ